MSGRWGSVERILERRFEEAIQDALEEGISEVLTSQRLERLRAFAVRQVRELGVSRAPVFGFLEDGRFEITFGSPSPEVERTTFFVDEATSKVKRVTIRPHAAPQVEVFAL